MVCVDSDGQHSVEDTINCARILSENQDSLVIGCRSFDDKSIPLRSRFGNKMTKIVLSFACGIKVSDTQTGLRGLPKNLMQKFLTTSGERYEYEMNMLIETKEKNIPIIEIPIKTIYINNNSSSHFNPIRDSMKIYRVFGKFFLVSMSSFLLDMLLFQICIFAFKNTVLGDGEKYIVLSTVLARVFSSIYNYMLNTKIVFKSKAFMGRSVIRYYTLAFAQMLCSSYGVVLLYNILGWKEVGIKIIVDVSLFFISFLVQREWVFKNKNN